MIIYISGPDSFLASRAISQLKAKYKEKNPDGAELIEISPDSVQINWADLMAVPLFATSRLVIVKLAGKMDAQSQENLAYFLANLPSTTVAVVWDDKRIDAKSGLSSALKAAKQTISAQPLDAAALQRWVNARAKELGVSVTPATIGQIISAHDTNLWAIENELVYLSNAGSDQAVNKARTTTAEPFAVFNYIRANNWKAVGRHIRNELHNGLPIEVILGGVAAAVRKEVHQPAMKQVVTELMMDVDVGLKTGGLDEEAAAALLVAHLPQPPANRVQWEKLWEEIASS